MKAIIVDDERLARQRISTLLNKVDDIEIIGECKNGKNAIIEINKTAPDLVFLDINMKDLSGFQVHFEVEAFDFLLKPFKEERFFKTINKILKTSHTEADKIFEKRLLDLLKMQNSGLISVDPQQLPIREGNKTILVDNKKIQYIIASGYYAEIYTKEKKYVIRESLNNLIKTLNDKNIIRVHRSAIINLKYIQEIVHSNYSEIDVRMKDNKLIRISKSQKKEFLAKIGV